MLDGGPHAAELAVAAGLASVPRVRVDAAWSAASCGIEEEGGEGAGGRNEAAQDVSMARTRPVGGPAKDEDEDKDEDKEVDEEVDEEAADRPSAPSVTT